MSLDLIGNIICCDVLKDGQCIVPAAIHLCIQSHICQRIEKMEKNQKHNFSSFHECMRLSLVFGQIFALLPVFGIYSKNAMHVKYVNVSWKCIYVFLTLIGQGIMLLLCCYRFFTTVTTLDSTSSIVFFGTSFITTAMFFKMAKSWPKLVRYISKIETLDPCLDFELVKRCNNTCVIVLSLSLLEHIMSMIPQFIPDDTCVGHPRNNIDSYEKYVSNAYPWVFSRIPYNIFLGCVCQFVQIQSTFAWNFSDLFVIIVSYYLTSRLDQVNKKLEKAYGKPLPEQFWRAIREEYGRATQLVRRVDDVINGVTFVSFANNLFFICLQLFYSFEKGLKWKPKCSHPVSWTSTVGYVTTTYFVFSLVYLIGRSMAVSLISAEVHTASKLPSRMLYVVPSSAYCIEVQRFLAQVNGEKVALTGLQFFSATRGLLLTIAGTIVTYELVMFQFSSSPLIIPAAPTAPALDNTTYI